MKAKKQQRKAVDQDDGDDEATSVKNNQSKQNLQPIHKKVKVKNINLNIHLRI